MSIIYPDVFLHLHSETTSKLDGGIYDRSGHPTGQNRRQLDAEDAGLTNEFDHAVYTRLLSV